ncbi:hypothetical protein C8J56DRAFT_934434 [Mycena floridula]|nr:hypothetical protein C8J56DRAFT_934434 [Mycena floridula]
MTSNPPSSGSSMTEAPESDLTPVRAHYLKKTLIQLQFNQELDEITTSSPNNISTFSYLDAPPLDLPFLRFMFRQFVLTFPFMAAAPKDFYSDKLQPFMASVLSRNLSPTSVFDEGPEDSEKATRMKLLAKLERNLGLFMGSATKLVEPEQVVRLTQVDLDRLEELSKQRQAKNLQERDIFEINIVSVRNVVDKGRVRSRVHEEFIVRTRRSHQPDWFVSRRYGDFKTLAMELRKAHPQEEVRPPPPKDRTTVSAPSTSSPTDNWDDSSNNLAPSRLTREKNRLTLRAYLHSLLTSSTIASSPVLKSFLLANPTTLSAEEIEDAKRREEADKLRDDGRKRFAKEIASRVDSLREAVKSVKGDIMSKDGLTQIFATVKVTPDIRDLPANYQAVLEWARMSLAATIFQQLVASDTASETFTSLKRLHGLMPYFMLKAALKVSNPISMIRGQSDVRFSRMFSGSLTEEVKELEDEIEAVKNKVEDPLICEKIRRFVYAPREIQDMYKDDSVKEGLNLLTIVLRSGDEPVLSRVQMHRVAKAHRAHAQYLKYRDQLEDSDDDDGPQNEDAWLYEDLKVLAQLYSRLRDREQLIALIFEGFTADLLKDIITIFYTPLAQVYRAASIADSLSDLQNFINDLIKTVEQTEEIGREDPHHMVQAFVALVQRHEQSFYNFVHKVHTKGESLFDSLMHWIELFITVIREGLGDPISLEFILPHTGKERKDILTEIDKVALYHYKLKVMYEDKLRRRFGRAKAQLSAADAEDEATQALVDGVVGEISFGDLAQGDANDLAAEETDEETDGSSSEYESSSEASDETESDGSSEDSATGRTPRAAQGPRSPEPLKTPTNSRRPVSRRPERRRPESPAPQRRRSLSLSLRTVRSMTFSGQKSSASPSRHSYDHPLPPVPPLPSYLTKPLPPSPGGSSDKLPPPQFHRDLSPSRRKKRTAKLRKTDKTLRPPELQHIPQLLPVFAEIMRPRLRPRQRTEPPPTT